MTLHVLDLTGRRSVLLRCSPDAILEWHGASKLGDGDVVLAHWTNLCAGCGNENVRRMLNEYVQTHFGKETVTPGEVCKGVEANLRLRSELARMASEEKRVTLVIYSGGANAIDKKSAEAFLQSIGVVQKRGVSVTCVSLSREVNEDGARKWLLELGLLQPGPGPTPEDVGQLVAATRLLLDAVCWFLGEDGKPGNTQQSEEELVRRASLVRCLAWMSQHEWRQGLGDESHDGALLVRVLDLAVKHGVSARTGAGRTWKDFSEGVVKLPGFDAWKEGRSGAWSRAGSR